MILRPDFAPGLGRGIVIRTTTGFLCAIVIAAVASISGCAHAPIDVPTVELDFPSPALGPGRPTLDRTTLNLINAGYAALGQGNPSAARSSAAEAVGNPASQLLDLQAMLADGAQKAISGLEELTEEFPGYAAAWLTLSVAAERTGDEAISLNAATRGAELWPEDRWIERRQRLEKIWVDDRLTEATNLFQENRFEDAIEALKPVQVAAPGNRQAALLEAKSLIELDQLDEAEVVISSMERDSDVILLAGTLAEARGDRAAAMRIYGSLADHPGAILKAIDIAETDGDWLAAMDLYASLPDEQAQKQVGLRRAKLRWRISVLPPYVQEAFDSKQLKRSELAVVLITLAPRVETLPGGQVPLLSDIMRQPAQREILAAVRLGLVDSDPLERRYHPDRRVASAEAQHAIDTLASLLAIESPTWCGGEDGSCFSLDDPVAGAAVADIVIDLVAREGS